MRFDNSVKNVVGLFEKLCACQNRELVYDLYTYVWDMCSVILTLNGFVQWLSRESALQNCRVTWWANKPGFQVGNRIVNSIVKYCP